MRNVSPLTPRAVAREASCSNAATYSGRQSISRVIERVDADDQVMGAKHFAHPSASARKTVFRAGTYVDGMSAASMRRSLERAHPLSAMTAGNAENRRRARCAGRHPARRQRRGPTRARGRAVGRTDRQRMQAKPSSRAIAPAV